MIIEKYYYTPVITREYLEVLTINNEIVAVGGTKRNESVKLPRITVCGLYDTESGMIKIGVSRCASRDTFTKKEGKSIAKKRAEENPYKEVFIGPNRISESFLELAKIIEEEILAMTYPIKL